nr:helix-turn-helix transcriptional regulator [Plantibacter sp. VKM Ac-2885]
MDNASEALKRTNAIAEIVGAHPIIREELAHRLHVEQTLPASIYAPAQSITLSERERDVLRALALYGSTKELAAALHVSPNTAKSHLASVYKKLGVHGREQALRAAAAWLDD